MTKIERLSSSPTSRRSNTTSNSSCILKRMAIILFVTVAVLRITLNPSYNYYYASSLGSILLLNNNNNNNNNIQQQPDNKPSSPPQLIIVPSKNVHSSTTTTKPTTTTTKSKKKSNRILTVLLIASHPKSVFPYSPFTAGTVERFSVRGQNFDSYRIKKSGSAGSQGHPGEYTCRTTTSSKDNNSTTKHNIVVKDIEAPCLIVAQKHLQNCKRLYPHCKVMLTNDEFCKRVGPADVREYDSSSLIIPPPNNKGNANNAKNAVVYLPLGPRADVWKEFQIQHMNMTEKQYNKNTDGTKSMLQTIMPAQAQAQQIQKPLSERKYVYNAMFSKSSSAGRPILAQILRDADNGTIFARKTKHNNVPYNYTNVTKIAKKWTSNLKKPGIDHMVPSEYIQVLKDSVFTISPTGRNPECFRLFEAWEAQSIPIIAFDKYYTTHNCQDSLRRMVESDAPMVVLNSWDELFPRIESLLSDKRALNYLQSRITPWYNNYMKTLVNEFEEFMLVDKPPPSTTSISTSDHPITKSKPITTPRIPGINLAPPRRIPGGGLRRKRRNKRRGGGGGGGLVTTNQK